MINQSACTSDGGGGFQHVKFFADEHEKDFLVSEVATENEQCENFRWESFAVRFLGMIHAVCTGRETECRSNVL